MVQKWGTNLEVGCVFGSLQVVDWGTDLVASYMLNQMYSRRLNGY